MDSQRQLPPPPPPPPQCPSAPPVTAYWQTSRFVIELQRPQVMGIVNCTPDSFSDGGQYASPRAALAHGERLLREGAHILDIGAESTRPGSPPVPLQEELERVLPVLREVVRWGVPISIDTYKAPVMQAALDMGVDIINDIWGLRQAQAAQTVAAHPRCGVCLMHMHRTPQTMQQAPLSGDTGDVVGQVGAFLADAAQHLQAQGVAKARIALDPGIGFGKTVEQNFALLAQQSHLLALGYPLLVGWSRKSSLGAVTGLPVQERLVPSVVAALLAVQAGASVVRVHDVRDTVAALAVLQAIG